MSSALALQQGISQPVAPAPKQDGFLHGRDIRIAFNRNGVEPLEIAKHG
jgi:hypothetical protein